MPAIASCWVDVLRFTYVVRTSSEAMFRRATDSAELHHSTNGFYIRRRTQGPAK